MPVSSPAAAPPISPKSKPTALLWKTLIIGAVVVLANVIGNYALTRGLRQVGVIQTWSPAPYIEAFVHPWVAAGVVFMVGWLLTRLVLLSWADLSYVIPVTSFAYVLSALAGALYLRETVTWTQWAGISVISLGSGLVALTCPDTVRKIEEPE